MDHVTRYPIRTVVWPHDRGSGSWSVDRILTGIEDGYRDYEMNVHGNRLDPPA